MFINSQKENPKKKDKDIGYEVYKVAKLYLSHSEYNKKEIPTSEDVMEYSQILMNRMQARLTREIAIVRACFNAFSPSVCFKLPTNWFYTEDVEELDTLVGYETESTCDLSLLNYSNFSGLKDVTNIRDICNGTKNDFVYLYIFGIYPDKAIRINLPNKYNTLPGISNTFKVEKVPAIMVTDRGYTSINISLLHFAINYLIAKNGNDSSLAKSINSKIVPVSEMIKELISSFDDMIDSIYNIDHNSIPPHGFVGTFYTNRSVKAEDIEDIVESNSSKF